MVIFNGYACIVSYFSTAAVRSVQIDSDAEDRASALGGKTPNVLEKSIAIIFKMVYIT